MSDPTGAGAEAAPVPRPRRQAAVGFVLITLGIDAFGVGVVIPVVPALVRQLSGPSVSHASIWVAVLVSAYAFAQFICAPILGGLSDRFGRRPVILGSVCGICVNYLMQAFAPTLGWILVGRLLAGATAANTSASTAYIADVTPPEQRAQRFGLIGATFGLGFILGPATGGLIATHGLRLPFILSAVMAGLNALYGFFVLPESLPPERRRAFNWRRANPVGSIAHLGDDGVVGRLAGAWSGLWFGICVLQSVFVLYTTLRFHWGPLQNGALLAASGVTQALAQTFLVKRAVKRFGESRAALIGCVCSAAAFVLYAIAPVGWMLFPPLLLQALGSVAAPAIRSMFSARAGPNRQGEVLGAIASVEGLTQIIAPLLIGEVFALCTAAGAGVFFPGAPLVLGAAMYIAALGFVLAARRCARDAARTGAAAAPSQ